MDTFGEEESQAVRSISIGCFRSASLSVFCILRGACTRYDLLLRTESIAVLLSLVDIGNMASMIHSQFPLTHSDFSSKESQRV